MKLHVKSFALAWGILWGIGIFLLAWWMIMFEGATGDPTFIGRLYIGFNLSPVGSLLGLVWGFFDGAIFGLLFALLYNKLVDVCK